MADLFASMDEATPTHLAQPPADAQNCTTAPNDAESGPEPKIGRNEPCPCGIGKKHKHCCLGKPSPAAA
ncbi:MAG: SEC-C metal-binding domain-containing protein [Bryobacteraceae bacterium]